MVNKVEFPETLYHGTALNNQGLENFKETLVNSRYWVAERDFGKGFYTTIDFPQAQKWAKHSLIKYPKDSAFKAYVFVISCNVEKYNDNILHQVYLGANQNWADFILHNRLEGVNNLTDVPNVISGPMADNDVGYITSLYKESVKEDKEWFYKQIKRNPKGEKVHGLGLGNQIVFREETIANIILSLEGWYVIENRRWKYERRY